MLRTITTLTQLLAVNVEASETATNNGELIKKWQNNDSNLLKSIRLLTFPDITGMKNLKAETRNYTIAHFESAFRECKNNISNARLSSKHKHIEKFLLKAFNSNRIVQILENASGQQPNIDFDPKKEISKIVSAGEIYRILLQKKAIPTVKIGNSLTMSLNEILKYVLLSLHLLCGDEKFNKSEEIKTFMTQIEEIRKKLNAILGEFYENGAFKKNSKKNYSCKGLLHFITSFQEQCTSLDKFLERTGFDRKDNELHEKRYLNLYNTLDIVGNVFISIIQYIDLLAQSDNWSNSTAFKFFIRSYKTIIRRLVIFAVPKSKIQKFISVLKKENEEFAFSIFDRTDGDFDRTINDLDAIEKMVDGEEDRWNALLLFKIIGVSVFFLSVGMSLIYYQSCKSKNIPKLYDDWKF